MKDLIAKLQLDANCALGAIWMHIDAQAARIAELEEQQAFGIGETYANALSRIAELEAQIAGASAPVVEQQPIGYLRQSEIDKLADHRVTGVGMMLHKEPGEGKIAVYGAPPSADTDKLREAIFMAGIPTMAINGMNNFSSWEIECWARGALAMRVAVLELMNDTALQAPVREVPEGWQPIETAPYHKPILLWWKGCKTPSIGQWHSDGDCLGEDREGWRCDGDQCIPTNQEDCTHWMPLPAAPVQQEGGE